MWQWIFGEWVLLALTVLAGILYARYLWKKISGLVSYVVYLLLSDQFHEREKDRFTRWMRNEHWTSHGLMMVRTSMFVLQAAECRGEEEPLAVRVAGSYPSRKVAA